MNIASAATAMRPHRDPGINDTDSHSPILLIGGTGKTGRPVAAGAWSRS